MWQVAYLLASFRTLFLSFFLPFFFFKWPHPRHMEVPRLRIESEAQLWPMPQPWQCQILFFFFGLFRATLMAYGCPQVRGWIRAELPAYTTATAMQDLSCIWYLYHSSQHRWILTHWARPGIKPASSWILIGFVTTTEPQLELPTNPFTHCARLEIEPQLELATNPFTYCARLEIEAATPQWPKPFQLDS